MSSFALSKTNIFRGVLFILTATIAAHLLFSWMGFTPTDEGFTLAYSRRLLDGQVPHRDFIIIRPFVSPLIHVPFVLLGGRCTFWISRLFVWFELASMAWLWTAAIDRLMALRFSLVQTFALALISFAASVHTKHITAWHSIDGLFFVAIGTYLCLSNKRTAKMSGYLLLGVAALCKQSFVFVAPLTLVVLKDWRNLRYWTAAAMPGLGYLVYVVIHGAFFDAWIQLTAHRELLSVGIATYFSKRVLFSVVLGCAAASLCVEQPTRTTRLKSLIALTVFYGAPLVGAAIALWSGMMMGGAFGLFGLLVGVILWLLAARRRSSGFTTAALLVILSAWSVSLSDGYNSPALMAGPLLVMLLAWTLKVSSYRIFIIYSLPVTSLAVVLCFGIARTKYIYRDQPAANLTQPIESVLAGGGNIYTNANTFAFMQDLQTAVQLAQRRGGQFAILPDVAAYWVKAPQQNPLPTVWPQADELPARLLMNRFLSAMEANRPRTIFILQKFEAKDLAHGFTPLQNSSYYEVVQYARTHFAKIGETECFELYQ